VGEIADDRALSIPFQNLVEQTGALGTTFGEALIQLLMLDLHFEEILGEIERDQNRDFARIDSASARDNVAHSAVNHRGQILNMCGIAIRDDEGIRFVINLNFDLLLA
jgi:hypothetical protein